MNFDDLIKSTAPVFAAAFGADYPVTRFGAPNGTLRAIHDAGGEVWSPGRSELVIVQPSVLIALADQDKLGSDAAILIDGVNMIPFGAALPDGAGFVKIDLVQG